MAEVKFVELNTIEIEILKQLSTQLEMSQVQMDSTIRGIMAAKNISKFKVQGVEGNKLTYHTE